MPSSTDAISGSGALCTQEFIDRRNPAGPVSPRRRRTIGDRSPGCRAFEALLIVAVFLHTADVVGPGNPGHPRRMVNTSQDPDCSGIDRQDIFGRSGDTANQVGGFAIVAGAEVGRPGRLLAQPVGPEAPSNPGIVERRALISWFPARLGSTTALR
jgi:hypothetical protein